MARLIEQARVEAIWDNGSRTEVGTIRIESAKDGMSYDVNAKISRRRIGWYFVRFGLRMILGGRRWREEELDDGMGTDPEEH